MSSLRNAVKRKTHKERSQPAARKKLGLLEKHKDYVLRARDFHKKDDAIKVLQEKAKARNPDEFYFGMERAGTKDGVHMARSSTAGQKYSADQLLLMKTQDAAYVGLKRQTEAKKVARLQASLHLIGAPGPRGRHTLFVDDDAAAAACDPSARLQTPVEFLGRAHNRPRVPGLGDGGADAAGRGETASEAVSAATVSSAAADADKRGARRRAAAYRELAERTARAQQLTAVAEGMALEKELMGRGSKRKLMVADGAGGKRAVYKWDRKRLS